MGVTVLLHSESMQVLRAGVEETLLWEDIPFVGSHLTDEERLGLQRVIFLVGTRMGVKPHKNVALVTHRCQLGTWLTNSGGGDCISV